MNNEFDISVFGRAFSSNPQIGKKRYLERRHERKGPKGYKKTDSKIREQVCDALYWHPDVDATDIDVAVIDGIVTLTGFVDSRHAKKMAEFALDNISEIDDVQNQLAIKPTLDVESDKIIARGDDGLFTEENVPR